MNTARVIDGNDEPTRSDTTIAASRGAGWRAAIDSMAVTASARFRGEREWEDWLPDMDLNHDKQIQSLLCYRYTIGQCESAMKVSPFGFESSGPSRRDLARPTAPFAGYA